MAPLVLVAARDFGADSHKTLISPDPPKGIATRALRARKEGIPDLMHAVLSKNKYEVDMHSIAMSAPQANSNADYLT